jgi:L-alanine-DL-glutamate epimerase-like enolase superfamily enzyme
MTLADPTIADVRPIAVTLDLDREPMSFFFVRVETGDGLVGYGESCDSYGCSYAGVLAAAVDDAFAPLLIGEPLASVDYHTERLRLWTRRRLGDQWVASQARSAIEIALWDVQGKVRSRSVSDLLGRVRTTVPVYASLGFLEEGSADHHLEELQPFLARGVRHVKLRVGPEWAADLTTLAKVRAALDGDVGIMVDGSECFTLPTALEIAHRLHELGVVWFEEPIPQGSRAAIEELVRRSPIAIAYGEHLFGRDDALDALRRRQLSVLQPDASTCGGIGELRRIAEAAATFGTRVVPHVCAGPVSLAANLHCAATVAQIRMIEYPPSLAGAWDILATGAVLGPATVVDGALTVPAAPGLGVGLDEAVAAAHPYRAPRRLAGVRAGASDERRDARRGLPDRFVGDR